jgi:hypothetical protein
MAAPPAGVPMVSGVAPPRSLTARLWDGTGRKASRRGVAVSSYGRPVRDATIADLKDGEEAIVLGVVEAAGPPIEGPKGPCVYWEKRKGMGSEPSERGGERFWVVDGDERVLVPASELTDLSAKGDWAEEVVQVATSEIQAVSRELSELKDRLKKEDRPELRRRRKKLAKVATLLCSIKAHARGNVHGKGTLESQARWISKNEHLVGEGPGKATVDKAVNRLVVVLEAGDPVSLSGRFHREPVPPGLGTSGGYRDRPTCWIVRQAHVVGRKEAAAAATPPSPAEPAATRPESFVERTSPTRTFDRGAITVVSVITAVAALLWLLKQLQ